MSIIVLGTVALDTVKTPYGAREHMLGGSAVHFAMAARLFTEVNLVAVVGSNFPRKHIDFLRKKGINLSALTQAEGKTFQWKGRYQGDLNTACTLNTELGVLTQFKPKLSEAHRRVKHIFLANVDPDIQQGLLSQMRSPRLVALDSMNYWIIHKRRALLRVLKNVDIYVANDQEARSLTQESNLIKAAKSLYSLGPRVILIKKGENGVLFYSDKFTPPFPRIKSNVEGRAGFIFLLPAYPTDRVVDPTGAGDTFAGGFMGYLAKAGRLNAATLKMAVAYGTIAASFSVEGFGLDKTARLTMRDLEKRLVNFKKCLLF